LQSEIIANNPEMQINLDACAQVQYEARAEFWRPRGNDEGWWEYQWRTIYATLVMNAEAVGTSGF
jgi:hypothetical protein